MAQPKGNRNQKVVTAGAGDIPPVTAVSIDKKGLRMVAPSFRVPYEGNLIVVTAESLQTQPEILEHMLQHYPECFEQIPVADPPAGDQE